MTNISNDFVTRTEIAGQVCDVKQIGTGGVANIFCATPVDASVAPFTLKLIHKKFIYVANLRKRFACEYNLLRHLDHAGLPQAVNCGRFDDRLFISYRYIRGRQLLYLLWQAANLRGFDYAQCSNIIYRLLDTLDYLHSLEKPIVHCDISPENILIGVDGNQTLIDFGSAQRLDQPGSQAKTWIGKPSYLSPEQAQGYGWDHRSDIYQAGIIFYELLTGEKFILGKDAGESRAIASNPPAIDVSKLPRAISPIIKKMLAPEPRDRWESALQCSLALRQADHSA